MRHRNAAVIAALTFAVASTFVPARAAADATTSIRSDSNGDGYSDLAIGVPGQDLGVIIDAGQVNILYGSSTGLTAAGDQVWTPASPGIKGIPDGGDGDEDGEPRISGDMFGGVLASGDFDGDGYADLAVTAFFDRVNGASVGAVNVIYGNRLASTRQATSCSHRQTCPGRSFGWVGSSRQATSTAMATQISRSLWGSLEQPPTTGWTTGDEWLAAARRLA